MFQDRCDNNVERHICLDKQCIRQKQFKESSQLPLE